MDMKIEIEIKPVEPENYDGQWTVQAKYTDKVIGGVCPDVTTAVESATAHLDSAMELSYQDIADYYH